MSFLKQKIGFFFKFCTTLCYHGILLVCTFSAEIFSYFQQKESIKIQIWWNFTSAVESLKLYTLVGSIYKKTFKVSVKKVQKTYLSWHGKVMQSFKKSGLMVPNMRWGIWWSFPQLLKNPKLWCVQWKLWNSVLWSDPFVRSIQRFIWKRTEEVCLIILKSDAKF